MGIGNRLKEYRKVKGISTSTRFSQIIGISQGSLSDIEHEKTFPSADTLQKIVHRTDINAHWLLVGEGPMTRETEGEEEQSIQRLSSLIGSNPNFGELCHRFVDILWYLKDKYWEGRAFTDIIDGFHARILMKNGKGDEGALK